MYIMSWINNSEDLLRIEYHELALVIIRLSVNELLIYPTFLFTDVRSETDENENRFSQLYNLCIYTSMLISALNV
jgi:hypothetical protein